MVRYLPSSLASILVLSTFNVGCFGSSSSSSAPASVPVATEVSESSTFSPATALGWLQSSPSASASLTASWTPSSEESLIGQSIQFFSDGNCGTVAGSSISLDAAADDYAFTGTNAVTHSYLVISFKSETEFSISDCSDAITVSLGDRPALTLGAPSVPVFNRNQSTAFAITYVGAAEIDLQSSDISYTYTGTAANCTATIQSTSSTVRTVTVGSCTGEGSVRITIGAGSSTNGAGGDLGVGPSAAATVHNSGCIDANADNYDPIALDDDASCAYFNPAEGCTDPGAGNYDPNAVQDDGSCLYD